MSNVLTNKEMKTLSKLGKQIVNCLSCDINGSGVPCRTDRLESIRLMIEYLKIHDLKVEAVQ